VPVAVAHGELVCSGHGDACPDQLSSRTPRARRQGGNRRWLTHTNTAFQACDAHDRAVELCRVTGTLVRDDLHARPGITNVEVACERHSQCKRCGHCGSPVRRVRNKAASDGNCQADVVCRHDATIIRAQVSPVAPHVHFRGRLQGDVWDVGWNMHQVRSHIDHCFHRGPDAPTSRKESLSVIQFLDILGAVFQVRLSWDEVVRCRPGGGDACVLHEGV